MVTNRLRWTLTDHCVGVMRSQRLILTIVDSQVEMVKAGSAVEIRDFVSRMGGRERKNREKTEVQIEPRGWSGLSWYSSIWETAGEAWKENPERGEEIPGFLWEIYKWGGGAMGLEGLNSWGWGSKVKTMRAKSRKKRGFDDSTPPADLHIACSVIWCM